MGVWGNFTQAAAASLPGVSPVSSFQSFAFLCLRRRGLLAQKSKKLAQLSKTAARPEDSLPNMKTAKSTRRLIEIRGLVMKKMLVWPFCLALASVASAQAAEPARAAGAMTAAATESELVVESK